MSLGKPDLNENGETLSTLEIIQREINTLSAKTDLSFVDTKRLDILVKLQHSIVNQPKKDGDEFDDLDYSDEEIELRVKSANARKAIKDKFLKREEDGYGPTEGEVNDGGDSEVDSIHEGTPDDKEGL